jgi:hypothetical protein
MSSSPAATIYTQLYETQIVNAFVDLRIQAKRLIPAAPPSSPVLLPRIQVAPYQLNPDEFFDLLFKTTILDRN